MVGRSVALRAVAAGLTLAGLALAANAAAAGSEVLRLSLEQALDLAVTHSPELQRRRAVASAGAAEVESARAASRGRVDATTRYLRHSDVPEYAVMRADGSRQVLFPNIPNRWDARVDWRVPVWTAGRIGWATAAARHSAAAAARELEEARAALALEVTGVYLQAVMAGQRQQVLAEALTAFEAHLTDVRNQERLGLAARNDLLAVQVERDQAQIQRVEAAGEQARALAELAVLVGAPAGVAVEAADAPEQAVPPRPSVPELTATATAQRPALQAAARRAAAADAAAAQSRAERWPTLAAGAGVEYARPNAAIVPPRDRFRDTWHAAVDLAWPLWDGGMRAAARRRAEALAAAAHAALEEAGQQVERQVSDAALELETATQVFPLTASGLEAATENLRVAGERFRAGLVPSSQLLDAETALLRAELQQTAAQIRLRLAAARLDWAVGRAGSNQAADDAAR